MKRYLSSKIDIEVRDSIDFTAKNVRVLFFGKKVAEFEIKQGSTKITRI